MAGITQACNQAAADELEIVQGAWLCLRMPDIVLQAVQPQAAQSINSGAAYSAEVHPHGVKVSAATRHLAAPWVVLRSAGSSKIIAVDSAAAALGIACTHTLAQARVIAPELRVYARQAEREDAMLENLACVAYQFSHQLVLGKGADSHGSDAAWVNLEIAASLQLFRGLAALLAALKLALSALMLRLQLGIAPNPEAALVLAQSTAIGQLRRTRKWPHSLKHIALKHSALAPATLSALASMGVHDFDALLALPMPGLRKRFGDACVNYLTLLQQRQIAPQKYWQPPEQFVRHLDFGFNAENVALLAFPIKRLLRELALYLQACDAAVQNITLTLRHHHAAATELHINMLSVTRDPLVLESLVNVKLESLRLAKPVVAISLCVQALQASTAHTPDLFSTTASAALTLPRLLERLQNKLDSDTATSAAANPGAQAGKTAHSMPGKLRKSCLQTLHWQHDYRPELASGSQPLRAQVLLAKPVKIAAITLDAMPARPLWLVPPQSIDADKFSVLSGPERIESGWWDGVQLGDVRRDYYVAQLHSGERVWLYQERPAPGCNNAANWYLHGYF